MDIDPQACEVAKLNLLLKVLEGENQETLNRQFKLFRERALPDLDKNIKCGNSLIGPDFFKDRDPDPEELRRINPFDWKNEFPEIFAAGGFDAVIGNPPYVRQESLGQDFKGYAKAHFETYAGTADLYVYFIEQSHRLLKPGGYFGMICSNKFMRSTYGKPLRDFLATKTTLRQIVDFGELKVFRNASTFPAIFLTQNTGTKKQKFIYAPIKRLDFQSLPDEVKSIGMRLDDRSLEGDNWTLAPKGEIEIFEKMKRVGIPLGEYVENKILRGIVTGYNEAFVIDRGTRERLIGRDPENAKIIRPFVVGDDVRRYRVNFQERYLISMPDGWTREKSGGAKNAWGWLMENYPAIAKHLLPFADKASERYDQGEYWWELRPCAYYTELEKPKIVWPEIAKESRFGFDRSGFYLNKTCFFIPNEDLYLLGLLNSRSMWFFMKRLCPVLGDADKRGRLLHQEVYISQLPIRPINPDDPEDKKRHNKMVSLVEKMLDLHRRLAEARTPNEKERLQRQIDATDKQIDELVYELYGLTEEEIRIVEGGVGR